MNEQEVPVIGNVVEDVVSEDCSKSEDVFSESAEHLLETRIRISTTVFIDLQAIEEDAEEPSDGIVGRSNPFAAARTDPPRPIGGMRAILDAYAAKASEFNSRNYVVITDDNEGLHTKFANMVESMVNSAVSEATRTTGCSSERELIDVTGIRTDIEAIRSNMDDNSRIMDVSITFRTKCPDLCRSKNPRNFIKALTSYIEKINHPTTGVTLAITMRTSDLSDPGMFSVFSQLRDREMFPNFLTFQQLSSGGSYLDLLQEKYPVIMSARANENLDDVFNGGDILFLN